MADWIQWFCSMEGHDFFCEVDRSFIESRFNLYGLNEEVRDFSGCFNIILDYVSSDSSSGAHPIAPRHPAPHRAAPHRTTLRYCSARTNRADDWNREEWSKKECMDLYGTFTTVEHGQAYMKPPHARARARARTLRPHP